LSISSKPPGGVKQGQQFVGDVVRQGDADLHSHRIPTGTWRDGVCDCFANGVCHPMLWLACCCCPLAVGQILTRMNLTATGRAIPCDGSRGARTSAFKVLAFSLVLALTVDFALAVTWFPYRSKMSPTYDAYGHAIPPDYSGIPTWVWIVRWIQRSIELLFGIYLLVLLLRARSHARQRYGIPERCCTGGFEDCCCSFWLPCCTTLQIARHTADYDTHPAACCTETGLPAHLNHPHDFDPGTRHAHLPEQKNHVV
jgi:Cys-rich protein (TIGR01571 family)